MKKIIIPIITILIIFFIISSSIYLYKINELKKYNKQLEDNIYKYNELKEEINIIKERIKKIS